MAQELLPFKYEIEESGAGMTALGGLPLYMDLGKVMGLTQSIRRHVKVREGGQGWTDVQMITGLVLLNLAGGEHVEDIGVLAGDEGFCELLQRVEWAGMKRKERREQERRWRKEKERSVPSASAVFRYLAGFHEAVEREAGKAIIPRSNEHLQGLQRVNEELVGQLQKHAGEQTATLDMDATLVATGKAEALYCYKHYQAYQPLNTYWAEAGVVLHSEFRDGNVPAGYEQLRVFQEALGHLPAGVEKVRLRSDTAGYQHDLLRYCELGKHERFGRIEFAISSDVTAEFKKAVCQVGAQEWQPIYRQEGEKKVRTGREWAEVCFVPNKMAQKKGLAYRYIATREPMAQLELPGVVEEEQQQRELPFQTVVLREQRYKVFGMVTNMKGDGGELVVWQQERCGKSEEVHKVMKEDLAGGTLPSGDFGENAAWWAIMVLSLNLNVMMKRLVLGEGWAGKRMKAIRFHLICLPGRMVRHARGLVVKLTRRCTVYDLILQARGRMVELALSG